MEQREVVIVGGGPAGLAGGIVIARAQSDVLLIDQGEPRNAPARRVRGFLSHDGITPRELAALGRAEFTKYGGEIRSGEVLAAETTSSGQHRLTLAGGHELLARAVLVATGVTDRLPAIPGLRPLWGTSLFHCPHCHGHEVRGRSLGVIAGDDRERSLHQVALLRRFSSEITFFAHKLNLSTRERARLLALGVSTEIGAITSMAKEESASPTIRLNDGRSFSRDAFFVSPTPHFNDTFLVAMGCAVDEVSGCVLVDGRGQTSVEGVWATGNVIDPGAQVITAAGAAAAAAIGIVSWLVGRDQVLAYGNGHDRGGIR